jgi:ferredoxin
MKAAVDESLCAASGLCEEICPKVFKVVNGISRVQVKVVPRDAEAKCREAMENCPTGAISVEG